MVKYQMEFKAEEPADAGFASCGQIGEHLVPVDPPIVAYSKRYAVDVIMPVLRPIRLSRRPSTPPTHGWSRR
jgi:hypothetical protein